MLVERLILSLILRTYLFILKWACYQWVDICLLYNQHSVDTEYSYVPHQVHRT